MRSAGRRALDEDSQGDHRREGQDDREVTDVAGEGAGLLAGAEGLEAERAVEPARFEHRHDRVESAGTEKDGRHRGAPLRKQAGGAERQKQRKDGDRPKRVQSDQPAGRGRGRDGAEDEGGRREAECGAAEDRRAAKEIGRP